MPLVALAAWLSLQSWRELRPKAGMPPIAHGATLLIPLVGLALLTVTGFALIAVSLRQHHRQRLKRRRPHTDA